MPIASAGAAFVGERGDGLGHCHGHGGPVTAHGRRFEPVQRRSKAQGGARVFGQRLWRRDGYIWSALPL